MKAWGIFALNWLLAMVWLLGSVALAVSVIKARTVLTVIRFYFHLGLPLLTIGCFVNLGWRVGLISLSLWAIGLAVTPFYISRFERRAGRSRSVNSAREGMEALIYLRSFATANAMRGIENLIEECASSFQVGDDLRFQLNPIALGHDDGTGFPKFTTPDSDWWKHFEELTKKSAAIFLLPVVAHADPAAGILRETEHVFRRHPEKLIVIGPDAARWQSLPRAPGELFDAVKKWNEVRDYFGSVRPRVSIPAYNPSGFIFYMKQSTEPGASEFSCHSLPLSAANIKTALTDVTLKERQESKQSRKGFEAEFRELNGMSYEEYHAQPGKKLPPNMPM